MNCYYIYRFDCTIVIISSIEIVVLNSEQTIYYVSSLTYHYLCMVVNRNLGVWIEIEIIHIVLSHEFFCLLYSLLSPFPSSSHLCPLIAATSLSIISCSVVITNFSLFLILASYFTIHFHNSSTPNRLSAFIYTKSKIIALNISEYWLDCTHRFRKACSFSTLIVKLLVS